MHQRNQIMTLFLVQLHSILLINLYPIVQTIDPSGSRNTEFSYYWSPHTVHAPHRGPTAAIVAYLEVLHQSVGAVSLTKERIENDCRLTTSWSSRPQSRTMRMFVELCMLLVVSNELATEMRNNNSRFI